MSQTDELFRLMNLQIQCPQCSKRFVVHEDLTGKTVECGACDHRFPVRSESIIVERAKFYPGEQKGDFLNRLGKQSPLVQESPRPVQESANRPSGPKVDAIMPAAPAQTIAVAAGILGILFYLFIFYFGSEPQGPFQDLDLAKRLLLGVFVSSICGGLIVYGSKNWRGRGILIAVALVASLMALIVVRPVHMTPTTFVPPEESAEVGSADSDGDEPSDPSEILHAADQRVLSRNIDLQAANPLNTEGRPQEFVIGIYIPDLNESQYQFIEKYYLRKLALPKSEALLSYKRNSDRDRFIIISGMKLDFDTMVRISEALGMVRSYPEARVLKIELKSDLFQDPGEDFHRKLEDFGDAAFFAKNLDELKNPIDFDRIGKAVKRLATVRPGIELQYQPQITSELLRIVTDENDPELLSEIGKGLRLYAKGNQAALDKVNLMIADWRDSGTPVPSSFVDYLVENGDPRVIDIIDRLWTAAPSDWTGQYLSLGSSTEDRLIRHLKESPMPLKRSAVALLAQVGTSKCVPVLASFATTDDQELRILIDRALDAVKKRP